MFFSRTLPNNLARSDLVVLSRWFGEGLLDFFLYASFFLGKWRRRNQSGPSSGRGFSVRSGLILTRSRATREADLTTASLCVRRGRGERGRNTNEG